MVMRTLAALAALAVIGNGSLFAQQNTSAKVGDHLVMQMTGDLAAEYAIRTGSIKKGEVPPGLEISTTATIAQELNDGRIRIEHTSHIIREGTPARLVTLNATVESSKLTTIVTATGTPVYASPADHTNGTRPTLTAKETFRSSRHEAERQLSPRLDALA